MNAKNKLDALRSIFEDAEIGPLFFLGNKVTMPMENNLILEVTLIGSGRSGSYTGLNTSIVHRENGVITSNVFRFEQYLGKDADRTHDNASQVKNMYIWEDRGKLDWYIVRPKSTEPILDAVFEFALMYGRKS